ncbi:jmjd1a protein [Moniliophthora roreri MCA 2997]|uniref:Jmjd1a protein n=1 Tax=Moniliophthora roreri (strain MCA 2997) TaxID=1381753 RepID=V2WUZ2_MONRO|nr:jmjd1a protein [Moniliophthora roreri MCA 2997]
MSPSYAHQVSERASIRIIAQKTALPPSGYSGYSSSGDSFSRDPHLYQTPYQPQPQENSHAQPPRKRSVSSVNDDDYDPLAKKPKKRGGGEGSALTGSSGTRAAYSSGSKRGFHAKKRHEAANIIAQAAQGNITASPVSYITVIDGSGKGKSSVNIEYNSNIGSQTCQPEVQLARCMSHKYKDKPIPRCVSCTRRWAGDTCRFQGIRVFIKNTDGNVVGFGFAKQQKEELPSMQFPTVWNVDLGWKDIKTTKEVTAKTLLPVLKHEAHHSKSERIIYRPRESDVRATCDTCMTSLFCGTWMCRLCGRECCSECYAQVLEITAQNDDMTTEEKRTQQQRKDKHLHSNPFFLTCTKRNEHSAADFAPVSRFCQKELEEAVQKMEQVVLECDANEMEQGAGGSTTTAEGDQIQALPSPPWASAYGQSQQEEPPVFLSPLRPPISQIRHFLYPESYPPMSSLQIDPDEVFYPSLPSGRPDTLPAYKIFRYPSTQLTVPVFQAHWAKGTPLLIEGVLENFEIEWTPDYFIREYGTQSCIVVECQTETNKRVTVGDFFRQFGRYDNRQPVGSSGDNADGGGGGSGLGPGTWKLKDWPPSTDFKAAFPELYDDFSQAVPIPSYVRRDGTLNIASHFPKNTVAPDLGPKMYNAMASSDQKGSKGSTRLHMDMADALNIMTYAANAPDGSPGCAAWDLFRCEDSDKLRTFLKERFRNIFQHDPIHSQQVYLDYELRKELWEKYQVRSYRVYQRPGEAIFIPAGVAHQVVNLADCIKVAIDFVSPENVERCEKLTKEFREQNQSKAWKEDVLQLRSMMWFAWLSCSRQEAQLQKQR